MTAAMIRKAAELLNGAPDEMIVDFVELGSEGALLRLGKPAIVGLPNGGSARIWPPEYLIARNGDDALRPPRN